MSALTVASPRQENWRWAFLAWTAGLLFSSVTGEANVDSEEGLPGAQCDDCVKLLGIGDWGVFHSRRRDSLRREVARGLSRVAEELQPDVIESFGDNFYEHGTNSEASTIIDGWYANYPGSYDSLKRPWDCVLGNHDWRTDPLVQVHFTADPRNTDGLWQLPHFWYKRTYESRQQAPVTVDIFHIDTMIWSEAAMTDTFLNTRPFDIRAEQKAWLMRELNSSQADWRIVVGHHVLYSKGPHPSGAYESLADLDQILHDAHVDVYMNGHNHNLQLVQYQGTSYITSGAGAKQYCNNINARIPEGSAKFFDCSGGFVGLTFSSSREAELTMYDKAGDVMAEYTLETATSSSKCPAALVQRRRRAHDMCSCRRRSSSEDLPRGWACVGDSVITDQAAAPAPTQPVPTPVPTQLPTLTLTPAPTQRGQTPAPARVPPPSATTPSPTTQASLAPCFGQQVFITSHRNQQLEDRHGKVGLSKDKGGYQMWTIMDAGNNRIFLKSHFGMHLEDRLGVVGVHRDGGLWQTWSVADGGSGKVMLTSYHKMQLEDRLGVVGLHADMGGWQKWTITTISGDVCASQPNGIQGPERVVDLRNEDDENSQAAERSKKSTCDGKVLRMVERYCTRTHCTGDDCCKVVPDLIVTQSCGDYCGKHGLSCANGWWQHEDMEGCVVHGGAVGCQQVNGYSESNLICECVPRAEQVVLLP